MCLTEYDEEKTLKATFQEGKEEGLAEGEEQGSRKMARLIQLLMQSGRNDEVEQVLNDETERQKMLKQYADRLN